MVRYSSAKAVKRVRFPCCPQIAEVALKAEHPTCNRAVVGSTPTFGSSGSSRIEIAPKGDRWRVKGSSPLF